MPSGTGPAEAIRHAARVAEVYHRASEELVAVIARRLRIGLDASRHRDQQRELQRLRRDAERVVARAIAAAPSTVAAVVEDAYLAGHRSKGPVNQRAVNALARATLGELDRAGPAMLRWADDVYRQVTAQTVQLAVAGVLTPQEATARAMDQYAAWGVTGFVDRTGAVWRVDSYAEMATRTGIQRAHLAGTVDRLQQGGRDLVVVSASPAGCPICRPHEGQVYSLSGSSTEFPPLDAADGLFHPNCTHSVSAYTRGLTDPPATPLSAPELYRARQRQRLLERRVRESKRRVAAADELADANRLASQRALLARRQADLGAHLKGNPLPKSYVAKLRTRV